MQRDPSRATMGRWSAGVTSSANAMLAAARAILSVWRPRLAAAGATRSRRVPLTYERLRPSVRRGRSDPTSRRLAIARRRLVLGNRGR
jgi:hypothetical protein